VIIGKLIPAGTGMPMYRNIRTEAPEYEPLPFYTSEVEEEMDLATWLREASTNRQAEADLGAMSADVDADAPAGFGVVDEPAEAPVSLPGSADVGDDGHGDRGDVAAGD
jgi:hypothetical protein